jgi:parallel beta-helix repeat protein
MEIFESVAWVASGFVPTLLLLEFYERMFRRKVIGKKRVEPVISLAATKIETWYVLKRIFQRQGHNTRNNIIYNEPQGHNTRNNIIYNEPAGVFVSRSHSNQIYNNTVSTSGNGIYMNSGTNNKMNGNTLMNSKSHAILINNGSNGNTFYSNKIVSATKEVIDIGQYSTSSNNVFSNNHVINSASSNNTITSAIQKNNNSEIDGKGHEVHGINGK